MLHKDLSSGSLFIVLLMPERILSRHMALARGTNKLVDDDSCTVCTGHAWGAGGEGERR
jgi:hypothetical protein